MNSIKFWQRLSELCDSQVSDLKRIYAEVSGKKITRSYYDNRKKSNLIVGILLEEFGEQLDAEVVVALQPVANPHQCL